MYPVVVFDWDGTLFQSQGYKGENLAVVFHELGIPREVTLQRYSELTGNPRRRIMDTIYREHSGGPLSPTLYEQLSGQFSALNLVCGISSVLYPEVLEVLEHLHRQGTRLFISSSAAPEELEPLVAHFRLEGLIENSYGSRPGFSKGPEHMARICRDTGYAPDQVLFVGDDLADMELAQAAGVARIRVVREAHTKSAPYAVIPNLRDLVFEV